MNYEAIHIECKENTISGRYVNLSKVEPLLQGWSDKFKIEIEGYSVQSRPIYKCLLGQGKTKILMWSQMHGNESTTTKGLIDFLNFLYQDSAVASSILEMYSFAIIPILNPDGAEVYTRVNANEVDLNRDFQNLSQPESRLLMDVFLSFKPEYCYNLHDQRTIFGVGTTGKPATISFLAPSFNDEKQYDVSRMKSVAAIMQMAKTLSELIPGQIGRFDDGFNINCVGDTFQVLKTPTILIEAGHYPDDYNREETRKYVFIALLSAFKKLNENVIVDSVLTDYLRIPQNMQNFFDFLFKNVDVYYEDSNFITNFAVQLQEELIEDKIFFNGFIAKVGNCDGIFGHHEFHFEKAIYTDNNDNIPKLGEKADFSLDKSVYFVNGLVKK
ncbi:M14 family metallopeptidase [Flavobacterium tegetincola]|uniref:M14 family metallopeptidase n=1 Tax=Flavobacterium tegetincola TaxID=150172 RepID=UPI000411E2F9|nr:M14 metallopeptidase family protein [Flavobacterium tegetincola]